MDHWTPAYVGIGSNLDDPVSQVQRAFEALAGLPGTRLEKRSPLFTSTPMGPIEQPDFVNAVAGLLTRIPALQLMSRLHEIEDAHGRDRTVERWGPRTLDLDLLLYGDSRLDSPELTLPHPGLTERNFVVYPLAQIAPDLVLPDGARSEVLARRLGTDGLETIAGTENQ